MQERSHGVCYMNEMDHDCVLYEWDGPWLLVKSWEEEIISFESRVPRRNLALKDARIEIDEEKGLSYWNLSR